MHDFELAVAGQTSEDVAAGLGAGAFGMARETGEEINRAIVEGDRDGLGLGAALGRYLERAAAAAPRGQPAGRGLARWACRPPCTSPSAPTSSTCTRPAIRPRWAAPRHLDFRIFAAQVARLGGGGVYLNVGSAVLLPEVFLKAVTVARNLGHELDGLRHRQPGLHPVLPARTPTSCSARRSGVGRGYSLTGHHEILVPLLAAALVEGAGVARRLAASVRADEVRGAAAVEERQADAPDAVDADVGVAHLRPRLERAAALLDVHDVADAQRQARVDAGSRRG